LKKISSALGSDHFCIFFYKQSAFRPQATTTSLASHFSAAMPWEITPRLQAARNWKGGPSVEHISFIVARLLVLRLMCSQFPWIGSFVASQPLAEEAESLRYEMDDELAGMLRTHPHADVRRQLNALDATATHLSLEIRGMADCRPRPGYEQTAADFPDLQ
jgi:hypothetical protein